ncbi:hypothetical protein P4114_25195 [Pseudomonas aeruginosa]|nr:hypothetical protein [Pseudomonas aeruginosa]
MPRWRRRRARRSLRHRPRCSLGAILVAQSSAASARSSSARAGAVARLQDQFPRAQLLGGDADFERLVAQVVELRRSPQMGLDLPLGRRDAAFQERVWQARKPPGSTVACSRRTDRRAASGARSGQACAARPDRSGDSLPPRWYVTAATPAPGAWSAARTAAQGRAS